VTDLTADERKLLPLFTAMFLRSHASLRNQTNLLPPFPDCHECGQPVAEAVTQETHFPTVKAWTLLKPCEHRIELTSASAQRIADVAEKAAQQFEKQPAGSAPDWLRGGVCCGCQGAGGPVVYRNCNDQTFCSHCCECDCGTVPCDKPAPAPAADRRERYASLFRSPPGEGRLGDEPPGIIADAVIAVADREQRQLRAETERLKVLLSESESPAHAIRRAAILARIQTWAAGPCPTRPKGFEITGDRARGYVQAMDEIAQLIAGHGPLALDPQEWP
jgi:hypothetical protein